MIRVLLVDDQALVRSGFRIILETEPDIEVIGEAADGVEAVELAALLTPDVICMDVEMPRLDGIDASRQILGGLGEFDANCPALAAPTTSGRAASARPASAPAVLVLTTFGHERYLFDALAAGVSGFLLKTARAQQLIDAVRTLARGGALLGADVTRAVMERAVLERQGADPAPLERPAGEFGIGADVGSAVGSAVGSGAEPEAESSTESSTESSRESSTQSGAGSRHAPSAQATDCPLNVAGLTGRERDVLLQLATGASNAEIAGELFVGEATVKTHVSNILQKLGVRDRIQAVVWAHTRGIA